ncbi:DUF2339 domain-containing protein [Pedobacter sp. MR2016-19]|uniref:DUF2339 domain-containing protein n=1 Tax=Pedobacter sp. MR2016-19 TaxID=2780089 RepID=UPI00187518BB|nr:DUF2339 domain-containing protein [Pedobacter sp. MR2016-19]MBE5320446.1 DUF2339 domain-containing protein [Pedobacter sp. MR2016-19]
MDNSEKLNLLLIKLENLLLRQQGFEAEIQALRNEVRALQTPGSVPTPSTITHEPIITPPARNTPPNFATQLSAAQQSTPAPIPPVANQKQPNFADRFKRENMVKSDFEKFIGENLISKIGILILIIGVAIGAKYAIDHDMISPLTRIVLGYAVSVGLMAFAIKLKAKYENFSAVLVSGAIAIMYFITYAAYDFYSLIPQALAFALMVLFTSFTVVAAIKYNKQVIAHIGLVGAYAVPFLLSDGSGKVGILFTYMAIINIGILVLSFKKYWKPLFYASFGLTWIIFSAWRLDLSSTNNYFSLAILFSTLFFLTFYITNLAYKVSKKEVFGFSDVIILLLNSFVYYGIGYLILSDNKNSAELLGLFTLANAVIHFLVCLIIYKKNLADKNLFYLILAMMITFITMAVPVQLDGGWVTIFWVVEAAVLFYLARVKKIVIYEKLSFPLIFLAFFSLLEDWTTYYDIYNGNSITITPIINVGFLTACIFIACFFWMFSISKKESDEPVQWIWMRRILSYSIPAILVFVIYMTFRIEISKHFNNLLQLSKINLNPKSNFYDSSTEYNYNYLTLKTAWIYIYTLFFTSALSYLNIKKFKNSELAVANLLINLLVIIAFLTFGLYNLSELRDAYLLPESKYFSIGSLNTCTRYVAIAFFALLIIQCNQLQRSGLLKKDLKMMFDFLLYVSLLWIISSELINILELSHSEGSYKLGLSILWGVFSLFLISMGLAKNKKHLRIGAMVLFGITLIKLFLYDIYSLSTISKTIVFVSLGVLLLIISFLYNKYKHLIIDDAKIEN